MPGVTAKSTCPHATNRRYTCPHATNTTAGTAKSNPWPGDAYIAVVLVGYCEDGRASTPDVC
jgi:hypothetical protein